MPGYTDACLAAAFGVARLARARRLFEQKLTARALLRALFARGKVNFDPRWLHRDPLLPLAKIFR